MKRNIAVLYMVAFAIYIILSSGAFAGPVFESLAITDAKVTAAVLNIRQGASVSMPIICKVYKDETIKVFGKIDDWYIVYIPSKKIVGAASAQYLKVIAKSQPIAYNAQKLPESTSVSPTKQQLTAEPLPDMSEDEIELLNYVNITRSNEGINVLKCDARLAKIAKLKAKDMVNKDYFAHNSPTYGSPFDMMRQSDIYFRYAGENIAGNSLIKDAFDEWLKSEGHKKNILNSNFNYTGIAVVPSDVYGKVIVQMFIGSDT